MRSLLWAANTKRKRHGLFRRTIIRKCRIDRQKRIHTKSGMEPTYKLQRSLFKTPYHRRKHRKQNKLSHCENRTQLPTRHPQTSRTNRNTSGIKRERHFLYRRQRNRIYHRHNERYPGQYPTQSTCRQRRTLYTRNIQPHTLVILKTKTQIHLTNSFILLNFAQKSNPVNEHFQKRYYSIKWPHSFGHFLLILLHRSMLLKLGKQDTRYKNNTPPG